MLYFFKISLIWIRKAVDQNHTYKTAECNQALLLDQVAELSALFGFNISGYFGKGDTLQTVAINKTKTSLFNNS